MLKFLTAGESHGPQLTAILDGMPAGLRLDREQIDFQLGRRQKGYGRGGRMKIEKDCVKILSGVRHSVTLGSPVTLVIENKDWANWKRIMDPLAPPPKRLSEREKPRARETFCPRPGHADLAGGIKYNHHDLRNVLERASARETAARVAVGALCRQLLEHFNVRLASHVVQIGAVKLTGKARHAELTAHIDAAEKSEVRCIDPATSARMVEAIKAARKERDSLGGVVEVIVRGLPVGLGGYSQWTDRLDGLLAQAMMAIQSVKAVEIGAGAKLAGKRGSQAHDEIYLDTNANSPGKGFIRRSNHAGGLEGGITNGEDIIIRVAAKPLSTLNRPLQSVDVRTGQPRDAMVERTDTCVVPALAVICEAAAAFVLADAFLRKFGSDNLAETTRNYESFLTAEY